MDASNYQVYFLQKELSNLIKSDKNVATWTEVIDGLKKYIIDKHLFDFTQMRIKCKNDDLEKLFGVNEFSILDMKDLLQRLLFPIKKMVKDSAEKAPPSSDMKRKLEGDGAKAKSVCAETAHTLTGEFCSSLNQPDTSSCPMILRIPISPNRHESESDVDSVQCYETSLAQDTDDASDDSVVLNEGKTGGDGAKFLPEGILTIAETFELEYEPASSSEDLSLSDSDSDSDEFMNSIITVVCKTDSDQEFWADKSSDEGGCSESSYGFDAEISEVDQWHCSRCSSTNNPPNRFCSKCFSTRKGWLANEKTRERERRKPRSKPRKKQKKDSLQYSALIRRKKDLSEPTTLANSKSFDLPCTSKESPCEDYDTKIMFSQSGNEISGNRLCHLCCAKPVNSSIIHGKYAHSIACYRCSKRLQYTNKGCPICRRTIEKVVYQICAL